MTIPAWGWLVLRRVAGKRLPQHSEERKVGRVSVQTRALSVAWSFGFEIGQDPGRIAASEATNGKSRLKSFVRLVGTSVVTRRAGEDQLVLVVALLEASCTFLHLRAYRFEVHLFPERFVEFDGFTEPGFVVQLLILPAVYNVVLMVPVFWLSKAALRPAEQSWVR